MATSNGDNNKVSKFETLKLLEKCRKERDDALHRESVLREKLRLLESRSRSTETLKQKLKTQAADNKELRRQVRGLRADIGLEAGPKFSGKSTKDVVNDLHDKERQCNALVEKAGKLSLTIDDLTSELANTVTSKTLLEDQVLSLQQNLKDMTNNQRRLLKLWEDKKAQREQLSLPAIAQRPGPLINKGVQTEMSVGVAHKLPAHAFEPRSSVPGSVPVSVPGRRDSKDSGRRSVLDKHGLATLAHGNHHDKKAFVHDDMKGFQS
ncbi:hypothetical protein N1851_014428 [Merluccius polli]|uniref:Uncharacterized protein n=1 Tax=Merluccius polli TaxID=89951 RepID=A0AA47P2S0_MERPO|nr:hypothetical protein N1851_014428 [Merluccius polli]